MLQPLEILLLVSIGLGGGIIGGFLGVGGGIIFVPTIYAFYSGLNMQDSDFVNFVIANSLFLTGLNAFTATLRQYKSNNFYLKESLVMGVSGIVSALLFTFLISFTTWYTKEKFSIFFTLLLIPLIYRMYFSKKIKSQIPDNEPLNNKNGVLTGLFSGSISALSGLGGGIVTIPLLVGWLRQSVKKASSISQAVIVLNSLGTLVFYMLRTTPEGFDMPFTIGLVSFPLVLPLGIGVILGSGYGVKLSHKVDPKWVKIVFLLLIIAVLIKMNLHYFV